MLTFEVVDTLKIGNKTSILINDKGKDIKNGIAILDDNGKPYIVLSVGMSSTKGKMENTNILVEGQFNSKRIYV